ncbi:MAG: disulfide reductase [Methanosarcinaceae archaeon]|nr:disulfide reductase [Methanosarcinaceae archaeon]
MEYFAGVSDALRMTFVQVMILATLSIMIFLYGMYINLKKWGLGAEGYGQEVSNGNLFTFIKTLAYQMSAKGHGHGQSVLVTLVLDILLQRRILRRSPVRWFMHITIFIGWMALFVMSLLMFLVELIYMAGIHVDPEAFRELLSMPNDLFSYILMTGVVIAIIRRLFMAKAREATIAYDSVLLGGLTIIMITGFVADGIRNGTLWGLGMHNELAPPAALFHVVVSLLFCIAYIPYSKYIHMIAAPLALLANKGGE